MLTELNLVDGTGFDIPIQSIVALEGMTETKNDNFPTAQSYAVVQQANGDLINLLVTNEFMYLSLLLMTSAPDNWLNLTQPGGNPLMIMKSAVYQRKGGEDGTEVIVMIGEKLIRFEVVDSIESIRASMGPPAAPDGSAIPAGMQIIEA